MLALCILVSLALFTFPNAVPWMIACWLVWHTVAVFRGRWGWLPLLLGAGVVAVKRVPNTPRLAALASVAVVVVLGRWLLRGRGTAEWSRPFSWLGVFSLWTTWGMTAVDWHLSARCNHPVVLKPRQPVVCLGDSMTSSGLPQRGYPEHLGGMIALPVVNIGVPGIDTEQAMALLPRLRATRPQVVILELGAHDFLKGRGRDATKANLEAIIAACREIGAEVVLMEIPRGYMIDPFAGLERELARQYDLELIPDTAFRRLLLASPTLPPGKWAGGPYLTEDDGVHPNPRGNRLLARYAADALERLYGPSIRREADRGEDPKPAGKGPL